MSLYEDLMVELNYIDCTKEQRKQMKGLLKGFYADYYTTGEFCDEFDIVPRVEDIIGYLTDNKNYEKIMMFGYRKWDIATSAFASKRKFTGTKAYYDGISDPDEVEYGDGYPVVLPVKTEDPEVQYVKVYK